MIKWTAETLEAESRKYLTKRDFRKCSRNAFDAASRAGLLKSFTWLKNTNRNWTEQDVIDESKRYTTMAEFRKNSSKAYQYAYREKLLGKMVWLSRSTDPYKDCCYYIYAYIDSINMTSYIGLTCQPDKRHYSHKHPGSPVYGYYRSIGAEVPVPSYIERNITQEEALVKEDYYISYFKSKGYNVLNKAKTGLRSGSLGTISNGKWTKESVFEESRKYVSRSDFEKGCVSAYNKAWSNGWLDDMDWLKPKRHPDGYWTDSAIIEESHKYTTMRDFLIHCPSAYNNAVKKGLISDMPWLSRSKKQSGYWTYDMAVKEASKYDSIADLVRNNRYVYDMLRKKGKLHELFNN